MQLNIELNSIFIQQSLILSNIFNLQSVTERDGRENLPTTDKKSKCLIFLCKNKKRNKF